MNEKIENPKTPVASNAQMNDRDYLNDILETEKNISNNFSIALDEMSNKELFEKVKNMLLDSKNMARELYDLAFQKGWYSLEKAETMKINQKQDELQTKLSELTTI